ncbi:mechanosensitive ion channel [Candidatus Woesearchaeota archaeon]|nr:mechanosensitive ion channel [Candidatus Woesearchaeota archaeon]
MIVRATLAEFLIAIGGVVLAGVFAKLICMLISRTNKSWNFANERNLSKWLRSFQLVVILAAFVGVVQVLRPEIADALWDKFLGIIPTAIIIFFVWLVGYAIITVLFHIICRIVFRATSVFFQELDISLEAAEFFLNIVKMFTILIFVVLSLQLIGVPAEMVQTLALGITFVFIVVLAALIGYAFKDYLANFVLSAYISRNILKPGQQIKLDGKEGEVIAVTTHGVVLDTKDNYKMVIPNTQVVKERLLLKKTRSDISKLSTLISKHVVQLKSHCGPASISMMLSFFGYDITQSQIAKLSKLKIRPKKYANDWTKKFGTNPEDLINAVKKATNNAVTGKVISYGDIHNLRDELKLWFSDGALVLLWYKKPVLYPDKKSRSGHFVLGVGVEGDDILVMDPSGQTAGAFLIDYEMMEEAMAEHDQERGYIVFAKRGSPAYWRLQKKMYYSDTELYEDLGRTLERQLKKAVRKSKVIKAITSPVVELFLDPKAQVRQIWSPPKKGR